MKEREIEKENGRDKGKRERMKSTLVREETGIGFEPEV